MERSLWVIFLPQKSSQWWIMITVYIGEEKAFTAPDAKSARKTLRNRGRSITEGRKEGDNWYLPEGDGSTPPSKASASKPKKARKPKKLKPTEAWRTDPEIDRASYSERFFSDKPIAAARSCKHPAIWTLQWKEEVRCMFCHSVVDPDSEYKIGSFTYLSTKEKG